MVSKPDGRRLATRQPLNVSILFVEASERLLEQGLPDGGARLVGKEGTRGVSNWLGWLLLFELVRGRLDAARQHVRAIGFRLG